MTSANSPLFASKIVNELTLMADDRLYCLNDELRYTTSAIEFLESRKRSLKMRIGQAETAKAEMLKLWTTAITANTEKNT